MGKTIRREKLIVGKKMVRKKIVGKKIRHWQKNSSFLPTFFPDKVLGILATFQQDNTSRVGHLFEIALLDTVAFPSEKSKVFTHEGDKMAYINGTSREKLIVPGREDVILMGNGTTEGS